RDHDRAAARGEEHRERHRRPEVVLLSDGVEADARGKAIVLGHDHLTRHQRGREWGRATRRCQEEAPCEQMAVRTVHPRRVTDRPGEPVEPWPPGRGPLTAAVAATATSRAKKPTTSQARRAT